jgi:Fic family protein
LKLIYNIGAIMAQIWRDCDIIISMYKPSFDTTPELVNKLTQIENIRAQVDHGNILPERLVNLRYRASVEATLSSTSIEGNPLDIEEVEAVLAKKLVARSAYHIKEVENYKNALDYISTRKQSGSDITVDDILYIHKLTTSELLPDEKSGNWRTGPVYVVSYKDEKQTIKYTAPAANKIMPSITQLLAWLNGPAKQLSPVVVAAILHLEFVSIHPFSDGNGRTTRLLTLLYLGLRNYDFKGVLVPDNYYIADRPAYYAAIEKSQGKTYHSKGLKVDSWISYFTTGVLYAALETLEAITLATVSDISIRGAKLSDDELSIISYINQFGSISIEEASGFLSHIPRRTIQRRLRGLVDAGYINTSGEAKNTVYIANKQ